MAHDTFMDVRPLRVVIVGHVDHGKSTLVGRLLHDTGSLPDGKVQAIEAACAKRGVPFEWAFVMDALAAERDQNVTIDTSHIWLRGPRPTVIIDAPGHREFVKNMVTGASTADAALLLIAADEGVKEQSRRHATLLSLLGVSQVVVVVNKMDRVGFDGARFAAVEAAARAFLASIGVAPLAFIPIAARSGDNVAHASTQMAWYTGPTIAALLQTLETKESPEALPLRFPIQDVYRFDSRRILAGRIESGTVKVGDRLRFSPSGKAATVASLEGFPKSRSDVEFAGASIGLTLVEPIFIERGEVASHEADPPTSSRRVRARLFWLGRAPLPIGKRVKIKLTTEETEARIVEIERVTDSSTLAVTEGVAREVKKDDVADVVFETSRPLVFDSAARVPAFGRFVVVDGYDVAGGGIVVGDAAVDRAGKRLEAVSVAERAARLGHHGRVVVVAADRADQLAPLERALFERGAVARATGTLDEARVLAGAGLVALVVDAGAGGEVESLDAGAEHAAQRIWDAVEVVSGGPAAESERSGRPDAA